MINLSREKLVEYELEWFFCYSDADCGEKSNYMAMISGAYGGQSDNIDPYNQSVLNYVSRKVSITKRLNKLTKEHQIILKYTFGPEMIHPIINEAFGKYSAAANLLHPQKELLHLSYNSLTHQQISKINTNYHNLKDLVPINKRKMLTNDDRIKLSNIKSEAMNVYNEAITCFFYTKGNK